MSIQGKNVYVVLGMARSGTSAITKGLSALGIDLGETFTLAKKTWSPKGSWEDRDVTFKVNRALMLALNYSWKTMPTIENACQQDGVQGIHHYACDLVKERMQATNHWAFKDPRTTKVLPFWRAVFNKLNLKDHYIIALRNPLASASSFQRVTGQELEVGFLIWLMHMILAIDGTCDKPTVVVSYDLMMQDPRAQLARIKQKLAIPELAAPTAIDAYANDYLDKSLRHYEYNRDDLKNHALMKVFPLSLKIYDLLIKTAKDEIDLHGAEFNTEWQALKNEFAQVYPTYCYMDTLLDRNKATERKVRTINKSLPWKLVYPLRALDNFLRKIRIKLREKRKLLKSYQA